jgi:hypothetical protein
VPKRRKVDAHVFRQSHGQVKRRRRIAGHDHTGPDHRTLVAARDDLGILRNGFTGDTVERDGKEWLRSLVSKVLADRNCAT